MIIFDLLVELTIYYYLFKFVKFLVKAPFRYFAWWSFLIRQELTSQQ